MNRYRELVAKHEAEVNGFPFLWAFNQKQFDEGMRRLGLDPTDLDKIVSIGHGGYIRKADADALYDMMNRHAEDLDAAIKADETGEGFILDMFTYELDNHEYCITRDLEPTLTALGLTREEINASAPLLHGLKLAERRCRYEH